MMKVHNVVATRSILWGAACLMATSAIGPGFLTQTTTFTEQLLASFGFVILISIIIDIIVQVNIWRVIAVSEKRAQDVANQILPGLGIFLAALVVMGGLAFNIGNVGGAGLGVQVLFGLDPAMGALLSGAIAIGIFSVREATLVMDRFAQIMGFVMIALMIYVMYVANPPIGDAIQKTVMPQEVSLFAIVTLVGGTVGGYITFAGAHRLLDANIKGRGALPEVDKGAVMAISLASFMRIFLFLAVLGVVSQGLKLDPKNPAASVFQLAAGDIGYKIFGIVMWAAALTSVIGAAYTSVSFIRTLHPVLNHHHRFITILFIAFSTLVFFLIGRPVVILVMVGSLNGLILPVALAVMLIAVHRKDIVGNYRHPRWLTMSGIVVIIGMSWLGITTFMDGLQKLLAS